MVYTGKEENIKQWKIKMSLNTLEHRKVIQCVTKWTKCMCMKESTFIGLGSLLYFKSSLLVLHLIINKFTTNDKQRDLLCSCITITPLDCHTDWGTNDKYWRSHISALWPWAAFSHQGQIRPSLTNSYPTRLSVSFILGPVQCALIISRFIYPYNREI